MTSLTTLNKLAVLLENIAHLERKSEYCRQLLAQIPEFQPTTAFRRIDKQQGVITPASLAQFLKQMKVKISENELYIVFKSFDLLKQGEITRLQFIRTILPKQNAILASIVQSRRPYTLNQPDKFPTEVEYALAKYFQQQIQNHKILEKHRKDLYSSLDISDEEAFRQLDFQNKGIIFQEDLDKYLKGHNRYLSAIEVATILRVIDLNQDQKIDINQLSEILNPFKHGFYPFYVAKYKHNGKQKIEAESQLARSREQYIQANLDKKILLERSAQKQKPFKDMEVLARSREIEYLNRSRQKLIQNTVLTNQMKHREERLRRSRQTDLQNKRKMLEEKARYLQALQRQNNEKNCFLQRNQFRKSFQDERLLGLQIERITEREVQIQRRRRETRLYELQKQRIDNQERKRMRIHEQLINQQIYEVNKLEHINKIILDNQARRSQIALELNRSRNEQQLVGERNSLRRLEELERVKRIRFESQERLKRINNQTRHISRDRKIANTLSRPTSNLKYESPMKILITNSQTNIRANQK